MHYLNPSWHLPQAVLNPRPECSECQSRYAISWALRICWECFDKILIGHQETIINANRKGEIQNADTRPADGG